jgi:DNA modification methylase
MTELIWEGKYDAQGRKVAPPRIALPFQTVETVNESAADRQRNQDLFASNQATDWRNRLIWGDKKYVLPSLFDEFAGKVDLIYIDPPFDTGANFSYTATVPNDPDMEEDEAATFVKEPSVIEQKAYRDTWGKGQDGYLKWLFETLVMLRELLSEQGSVYVHLDWHVSHYAKAIADEVFGVDNFRNEVVWKRSDAKGDATQGSRHFSRVHDSILFYTKSTSAIWNPLYVPLSPDYAESFYKYKDPDGRRWKMENMLGPGGAAAGNPSYAVMGVTRFWRYSKERMQSLIDAGLVVQTKPGNVPMQKKYLDESKGVQVSTWWDDISMIRGWSAEKMGYATQKPEALLERVINASSKKGDLVLDCFCGSGTTAAVAEKLNRRWIACDLGRFAIHTTRKRLLGIPGVQPFVVQNLGKYERQAWQVAEFGDAAEATTQAYRQFVLQLYHAQSIAGYVWLHGNKAGRMVHVGGVDAPVTRADVTGIVTEFRKAVGTGRDAPQPSGVDVLGWDFAFELNETARQEAELAGINLRLIRIPREVLEKKAVEQGDIKFFELAALDVRVTKKANTVTLELKDFIIPLDDVPEDVQKAVTHWEQWIDYWAVDWDNSDDTFHNEWQTYRTRKDQTLARSTSHTYAEPGKYRIVVKVIDILGNDTTKLLQVEVK